MLMVLTEVVIRPPVEMTWPFLDQLKLVGVGLASSTREKTNSSPSSTCTVEGVIGRKVYIGGSRA